MRDDSEVAALGSAGRNQHTPHIVEDELVAFDMPAAQPAKRQRIIMDFVSVPPRKKTSKTTLSEASMAEMNKKMADMKNV